MATSTAAATKDLLRLSISSTPKLSFTHSRLPTLRTFSSRSRTLRRKSLLPLSKAAEIKTLTEKSQPQKRNQDPNSLLLDVSGMMCGACVSRVKAILSTDERVDSAVVNMLTETAAIRLRSDGATATYGTEAVADDLARRLTDCGFPSRRREAGMGIGENVRKWKEMAEKKEILLRRSRGRVAFAWTLVALCCGSHASHLLHSVGIHVAHGSVVEILHNSYVKCAVALVSLFGPGRDVNFLKWEEAYSNEDLFVALSIIHGFGHKPEDDVISLLTVKGEAGKCLAVDQLTGQILQNPLDLLFDGLRAFSKGSPNMNSLVGFGSVAAFTISAVALLNPGLDWDASFFDEPVMLLGFVLLGRSLEEQARLKASSDMNELLSLVSSQSRLVIASADNDTPNDNVLSADAICVEVPTDDVRVGDSVLVLPGETIPIDGKVLAGRSVVDESMLTGESLPVFKEKGLVVSAGTINWDGPLRIEALTTGSMSTISKIIRMVEDAQGHEAPIQRLADSIAGPFVYSVMTLSAATFAFWYYVGTQVFPDVLLNDIAGPDGNSLLLSLKLAVDVLVVSCPCALGLATPTAILVGTSLGAKQGLLVRGGDVLERLAGIDVVGLDKTGTLTEGKPTVTAVASLVYDESEILRVAAAVEKTASHPIAKAIISKAELLNLKIPGTRGQLTEPGFGSLAEVEGSLVAVGAMEWVHENFQKRSTESDLLELKNRILHLSSNVTSPSKYSKSVVFVGREGEGVIGAIAISDTLRSDALATVNRLQQKGIKPMLLSGDREEAVASVARAVGIESANVNASLTPQQKSGIISSLQAEGHSVAMVGDGINDAPSLALADVGIALQIEAKENAASDAASVILLGNRLSQIVDALDLAKATMAKVHQNLAWAVAYNVVAVPIAAGVLLPHFDFAMTPSLSGGLMAMSSIFVVTNSLLLQLHGSSTKRKS